MKSLICLIALLCGSLPAQAQALPAPPELTGMGGVPMAAQARLAPGSLHPAVELAKTFGGTDGYKYINGVLDKVATGVRPTEVRPR